MNCREFEERLLEYIDDELRGDDATRAKAHVEECPDCRSREAFERALEDRLGAALLSGDAAVPPDLDELLRRARPETPVARGGRLLSMRRLVAAAAALLLTVQAAWFFCIPPFECSYLQAVEAAAVAPGDDAVPRSERLAGIDPPAEIGAYSLLGEPELVHVGYDGVDLAIRARYSDGSDTFSVLWCDPLGSEPSFRRRAELDGLDWWIADENGRHLVAWMCPVTDTMCTLVGEIPEERLVTVASGLRGAER